MKTNKIKLFIFLILISVISYSAKAEIQGDSVKYFDIIKVSSEQTYMYLPDFTYAKNDISYDISGLKGKLIFINLWATWCGPCKKEIPDLTKLYDEFKNDNFEILGILVADKKENLENFLENNYINYPVINGSDQFIKAVSEALGKQINAIPYTIIADENGRIIETIVGSKTYEEFKIIINKHKNK